MAHRGPGGVALDGRDLSDCLAEPPDLWVFYGLDPFCDVADPGALRRALAGSAALGFHAFAPDPDGVPHDLLLPIPTVGERTGHLINLEGRWQSMAPATAPPGELRDGADLLAELQTALGFAPGLDGAALIAHCRGLAARAVPAGDGLAVAPRWPARGLLRVGSPSIYQQDSATRHAHALQQTELARDLTLRAHPVTLSQLGLAGAVEVRLAQDGAAVVLPLVEDARMPADCVHLATGDARLGVLGDAFGAVELSRV